MRTFSDIVTSLQGGIDPQILKRGIKTLIPNVTAMSLFNLSAERPRVCRLEGSLLMDVKLGAANASIFVRLQNA
jgi:hypothetical protein